jgi:hypothetical protein
MTLEPEARPDDALSGAMAAMHRAARRARMIARQTGTPLIICKGGQIEKLWMGVDSDGDRNVDLVDPPTRSPKS